MVSKTVSGVENYLAPLPLLLAGCLPFWAGNLLAAVSGYPLRPWVLLIGTLAVAALILAAGAAREDFIHGGGQHPARRLGFWPQKPGKNSRPGHIMAFVWLGAAAALGVDLQLFWRTGHFTIPLGALGILGGYFSFAPPLAWHRRGLGEVAGGLCIGLLPVLTGFYLQSGYWVAEELFYGLSLTLAGFNLFLIYGFPDPQNPAQTRHSLVERTGPVAAALIYTAANLLVLLVLMGLFFFPASPLPLRMLVWLLLLLAVVNQELLKRRAYQEKARLQLLRRLSLTLHLAMGAVFCLMLWQRL